MERKDLSNNLIRLSDYLDTCSNAEKRNVIYSISLQLKQFHQKSYYVPYLNSKSILIDQNDPYRIQFNNVVNGSGDEDFKEYQNKNIAELSLLSFAAYLPGYSISTNGLLNYEVVRDNFDSFSYIFQQEDVPYYKNVIVNNDFSYYSDYVDALNKNNGVSNTNQNAKVRTYSTLEGKLMSDNNAAFTSYLLLSINTAVILLIMSVLLLYLSK